MPAHHATIEPLCERHFIQILAESLLYGWFLLAEERLWWDDLRADVARETERSPMVFFSRPGNFYVNKPTNPYPMLLRRVLRRLLPPQTYRRYVGRHEDESLRLWSQIAATIPAGAAILDIGAFEGEYALAARRANAATDIYAFEPNPQSAKLLRSTLEQHRIHVVEAAVSDKDGRLPFLFSAAESQIAPTTPSSNGGGEIRPVAAIKLDTWVATNRVVPSLMKIDVEGAEVNILRGARRILDEWRPIVLCEVLTDSAGAEVEKELPDHYRFFHIDENRGTCEESRVTRRRWRNKNWLLVPEPRRGEVYR